MDLSAANKLLDIRFLQKSEVTYENMFNLILSCVVDLQKQKELITDSNEEEKILLWLLVAEKMLEVSVYSMTKKFILACATEG